MSGLCCSRLVGIGILCGMILSAGCGKKLPPMSPVSGKVTVDGQPLTAGSVTFTPDVDVFNQENAKNAPSTAGLSAGAIGSDGTYTISTAGKEGVPAGKYRVTVSPSMMPSGDGKSAPPRSFNQRFSDARNTPLKFEVPSSNYDLKLTK